jgi:DNA-binding IclR family transcriptional regulator
MPAAVKRRPDAVGQAVERTARVLLSFIGEEAGLGVSEIGRRLGLPKSAVHRTLVGLVRVGLVTQDPASSQYRLGARAADLGFAALGRPDIRGLAMPILQELVGKTEETATLSLVVGHDRLYAAQVESPQDVKMTVEVGRRFPLYAGASGRAILANLSQAQLRNYLKAIDLKRLTPKTYTNRTTLLAELERVRTQGFAVSLGERDPWAGAVAAPVWMTDQVVGSVSVCGPVNRVTASKAMAWGRMVREATAELSRILG